MDSPAPSPPSDIIEFLGRPRFVTRLAWSPTHAYDTELFGGSILDYLTTNTLLITKLRGYAQMRATLNIRITSSGSTFHAGMIMASWGCAGGKDHNGSASTGIRLFTTSQRSTLPHVLVSANDAGVYEMQLPFRHIGGYFDLSDTSALYDYLRLRVLNQLRWYSTTVAGVLTAPNVSLTVHAWFSDVQLFTPIPQSESSGAVGRVGKKGANPRGFASQFAHMALDVGLTAAGLGNPALPAVASSTFIGVNKRDKSDGTVVADTMYHHSVVEDAITPMDGGDPLEFRSVYSKEAWLSRIVWADATAPSNLAFFPVTPFITSEVGLTTTGRTGGVQLLPMGFVGAPFGLWRGSIKFRVQVIAPKMVRGSIRLQFLPRMYGVPVYSNECGDTYTITMDISSASETEMVIPFCASLPWLRSSFPANSANLMDSTTGNGTFVISAVEPLISNGVGVEINVFASGVDLEFANMGVGSGLSFRTRYISATTDAMPQTLAVDVFRNIRDAVKVPSLAIVSKDDYADGTANVGYVVSKRTTPFFNGAAEAVADGFALTPLAWYSAGFLARTGKYREWVLTGERSSGGETVVTGYLNIRPFCFQYNGTSTAPYAIDMPALRGLYTQGMLGYHTVATYDEDYTFVNDMPDYSFCEYIQARSRATNGGSFNQTAYVMAQPPRNSVGAASATYLFFQAAADDFALHHFQFVPVIFTA